MKRALLPRYYYGWNIVGVGTLAMVVSGIGVYSMAFFVGPMTAAFGWTRTVFSAAQTIQTMGNGVVAPFVGPFLDRRGARVLMVVGGLLAGLSLILTSAIQGPWQFYLFRGVMFALGMAAVGGMVVTTSISKFFIRMRGRAIGISAMGVSIAGIIVPPATAMMIEAYGWRAAWIVLGVVIWVLIIGPAALVMRRSPEDLGLRPDGDSEEATLRWRSATRARGGEAWASEGAVWTRRALLRCRPFWLLVAAYAIASLAMQGLFLHMIPFVEDQGHSRLAAAGAFTVQNTVALFTKPFWGLSGERFRVRNVAALQFALGGVGLLGVFLFARTLPAVYAFAGVIGTNIGGHVVNQELVWANSFGRQSLGLVRGIAQPFTVAASAMGPLLGGLLYDAGGSYQVAIPVFALAYFLATAVVLLAAPPRYG